MFETVNIIPKIPFLVFGLFALIVLILFVWGGITLAKADGDAGKMQKGRKILFVAFSGFFITLVVVFIFYFFTYLLKEGEVLQPKEVPGEFPVSPAINFPPAPQFIKIGSYYFQGPFSLKKYGAIEKLAIYSILCKKGENYDIIFIGETEKGKLLENEEASCWKENCGNNLGNLYCGFLWTEPANYSLEKKEKIKEELEGEINPACPLLK